MHFDATGAAELLRHQVVVATMETLFSTNPKHSNVYGIHLPYNVANFVGINVGTFLPYIECLEMKFIQYFRICQPCSTSLIRVFCKSFLLSLQICSGTPSIGGKDVFSA